MNTAQQLKSFNLQLYWEIANSLYPNDPLLASTGSTYLTFQALTLKDAKKQATAYFKRFFGGYTLRSIELHHEN